MKLRTYVVTELVKNNYGRSGRDSDKVFIQKSIELADELIEACGDDPEGHPDGLIEDTRGQEYDHLIEQYQPYEPSSYNGYELWWA